MEGKHHHQKFSKTGGTRATELIELVHTDVCGKLEEKSPNDKEYFLTFIDDKDKSRYVWTYSIKHKSDVFNKSIQWKIMVESFSGKKLKTIRSDNGDDYLSK